MESLYYLLGNLFLSVSIFKSLSLINETSTLNDKTTSVNEETTMLIWKWMLPFVSLCLVNNKYPSNTSHIYG